MSWSPLVRGMIRILMFLGALRLGREYAAVGRYEYVGMNRERGFSIAFDRATGEIVARGLPGASR